MLAFVSDTSVRYYSREANMDYNELVKKVRYVSNGECEIISESSPTEHGKELIVVLHKNGKETVRMAENCEPGIVWYEFARYIGSRPFLYSEWIHRLNEMSNLDFPGNA